MKPDQVQAGAFRDNLLQYGHQHGGVQLSQGTFQTSKKKFLNSFLRIDHIWMTLNPPTIPQYLQILMVFKREFSYYLLTIYVPSCMLVIVSWVSPIFLHVI